MKQKLVVVGNGMAGMRVVSELLKIAPHHYDITVFGEEPLGNYNRIMLSPLLSGEKTLDDIMINDLDWYQSNDIKLHAGATKKVISIDRKRRRVICKDGTECPYHRLLLTTGSTPFIIPVPGKELTGVITFRDVADVDTMLEAAKSKQHAIVIGGGLLGLEAANGLLKRGMQVTVVHDMQSLMNRQLDSQSADYLKRDLEHRGLNFKLAARTTSLDGDKTGHVNRISFASGESLPADIVVMAAGIRPNTALAQQAGLHCERGIIVSDTMQTYDPSIYAIGECIQHRGEIFGLVSPIWDQAKVCANHLAGHGIGIYRSKAVSTQLKVTGVDLFSAGNFLGDEESEQIIFQDPGLGIYKKVVIKADKVVGSVLYGDISDGSWHFQLMQEGTNIASIRDSLLFGQQAENSL